MGIGYPQTQQYLAHFRDRGCDQQILDNTEGIFNLCFYLAGKLAELEEELKKKQVNIVRLQQLVFGPCGRTDEAIDEATDEADADQGEATAAVDSQPEASGETPSTSASQTNHTGGDNQPSKPEEDSKKNLSGDGKEKPKGHGRYGIDAYTGAQTVYCECEHQPGDPCPQCHLGRVGMDNRGPEIQLQIDGHAPLGATRYVLQRLACNRCPWTETAQAPVDVSTKYTPKAKAVLAFLHYPMGLPYYRLARMQAMQGVPLAVSTQSELVASMVGPVHAIFFELIHYAAQCDLVHQDDTGVKILALLKENKLLKPERKGMYTSGFIGEGEHTVVLYFAGREHAGENFQKIIAERDEDKGKVTRMADALAANRKHTDDNKVEESRCNSHVFRRFRDLLTLYPEEAGFVLHTYGRVYENDKACKREQLDDQARLAYHQTHSAPLMTAMKTRLEAILEEIEPNGVLARECRYFLNHWTGLTAFLRVPGAPLDNNKLEAMLKFMITHRKNSLFFRTTYSAEYGSRLMSLMVTCLVNGIDAIDYLTQLQIHEPEVWRNPQAWLPWRYRQTLKEKAAAGRAAA